MKTRVKSYIFLMLILFNLGLVLISPTVKADEYYLGFADKTRLTLIYEYTEVDSDELEDLADSTEDDIYEDLSKIGEGDKLKIVVSSVDEKEDYWLITIELYSGESLDQRGNDFETKVYKNPEDLVDKVFDSDTDMYSLYFMPLDTESYLEKFEEIALEDDEYLEMDYELYVVDTELIFDYTPLGYSDTHIQEFGEDGILQSFEIFSDGEKAFKMELVDSYEDFSVIIYTITIIIVSVVAIFCVSLYMNNRKKKGEPADPKIKINKMLDDIK